MASWSSTKKPLQNSLNNLPLLKIKVPKEGFHSDAIEKSFFGSPKNFSVNSSSSFSTIKNLLWNGKILMMLKVLQGTIVANKEPLFFKSTVFSAVW